MLDSDGLLRKKRKSGNKFINSVVQIVLPNVMIKEVLDYYHSSLDGGHIGHNKLETNVSKLFWFPQLRCKVRAHVRLCTICQRIKPSFKTPYGVSHVIESPTQPFESVNIDTMGPIATSTKGNVHIIVCVDRLTRFLIAAPIPDIKATTVAKFLYNEVILKYNCPKRLTSDRGKCFMSKLFQDFLKNMSITHCPAAFYYASSDGLSEINNRKLIHIIRGYVNHKSDNWDQYISAAVKIINRNVNSTTGYSPFFLLYGYKPFNVFERKLGIQNLESVPDSQETDEYSLNTLQKAREEAIENVMEAEQKWAKLRNQNLRSPPFEVGDIVYVTDRSIEGGTHKKFKPPKTGLFCIVKEVIKGTYRLVKIRKGNEKMITVNSRMVFPYFGKPPQFHRELLHKITRGVFENRVPTDQENQIYDIEDAIKWEQMVIEIERQRKEEEELRKTHKTSKTVTTTVTQVPSDSTQATDNQNFNFTQISRIRPTNRPITPIPFSPVMPTDVYTSGPMRWSL